MRVGRLLVATPVLFVFNAILVIARTIVLQIQTFIYTRIAPTVTDDNSVDTNLLAPRPFQPTRRRCLFPVPRLYLTVFCFLVCLGSLYSAVSSSFFLPQQVDPAAVSADPSARSRIVTRSRRWRRRMPSSSNGRPVYTRTPARGRDDGFCDTARPTRAEECKRGRRTTRRDGAVLLDAEATGEDDDDCGRRRCCMSAELFWPLVDSVPSLLP